MDERRWYDGVWAALIYFTRLPLWRLHEPPVCCYASVVEWWPLTGWLTGGLMGLALWLLGLYVPFGVAVLLAVVLRLLLTGAFHEDGLADFCDGFGGGADRDGILRIMKDSRIGTYGVLGLVMYELLFGVTLYSLGPGLAAVTIAVADPYGKLLSSHLVVLLPYARNVEESKAGVVYRGMSLGRVLVLWLEGLLPAFVFFWLTGVWCVWVLLVPLLLWLLLYVFIKRRLGGYTGDCCGAVYLLTELCVCIAMLTGGGSGINLS